MEILKYTANGVIPVFLVIFVGIALNKLKFFSQTTKDEIVKLVFYVGTPCLIFANVAYSDIHNSFDLKFEIFVVIAILLTIALMIALSSFIKEPAKKGAVVQIGYRSNFAIVGMPLALSLLDNEGVTLTAVTLSFVIITYNITAVLLLSHYGQKQGNIKKTIKGILTNPLIIGTVTGLVFAVFKIPLFEIASKTIDILGEIASCMGLIVIGATITLEGFKNNKKEIILSVFFRNALAPVFILSLGILMGYRGNYLMTLAIMSCAPAAVNCFVMAKKMGVSPEISAYGVSITSILSIVSIFVSIYILKITGLS